MENLAMYNDTEIYQIWLIFLIDLNIVHVCVENVGFSCQCLSGQMYYSPSAFNDHCGYFKVKQRKYSNVYTHLSLDLKKDKKDLSLDI